MKTVVVNDNRQKGYTYQLTKPIGRNFDPDFKPQLTPKQMLKMGVFGGFYFDSIPEEFPESWFVGAKLSEENLAHKELNYFGVLASQSLSVWEDKGWIHKDDPLGWFQWYCRYYYGRRHEDDARQIKRWRAIVRHLAQIAHNCRPKDIVCRPKQRQAVLQWAYDSRKI